MAKVRALQNELLCYLDYFLFVSHFGLVPRWQVLQFVPFLVHCHLLASGIRIALGKCIGR